MKRNLTLLTILGALITMAVPASSMAVTVTPAGHKFEMSGNVAAIKGSLPGYCRFTKLAGSVPAAPKNEAPGSVAMPLSAPTTSCDTGVSIAIGAGEWSLLAGGYYLTSLRIPAEGVTLRYTSLPGCKLVGGPYAPMGYWSNGMTAPTFSKSGYHADGIIPATWSNDGASCAMAEKSETLSYHLVAPAAAVTDTTNPANVIQMTSGF
jgi:hypothetical protein